ncbi:MAG: MBL fold metallo-hydrolase RNA specificity domain-containing protein, partial [Candidatus Micrarchaeota archaeon]
MYSFMGKGVEKVFTFSDHSDYAGLMNYVEQSGAKKVYTVHGYEKEFARAVQAKLKVQAAPLKKGGLTNLFKY